MVTAKQVLDADLAPAESISAPEQGQVCCGPDRTIRPDTIRDDNAKAVRVEACHFHLGRCVPVEGLRPRYRQIEVRTSLPAGETCRSDP